MHSQKRRDAGAVCRRTDTVERISASPSRLQRGWGCADKEISAGGLNDLVCVSCRYALTGKEVQSILMQRLVKVDGKVRTDHTYPTGFMDVISMEKTDENFRLVLDTKGRFVVHRISKEEAAYKLCRVSNPAASASAGEHSTVWEQPSLYGGAGRG